MRRLRVLKVVSAFLLTFLLGGVAGWQLKPGGHPLPQTGERITGSQRVMNNLDARLGLSTEQKASLKPLLEEWGRQVERLGRQPRRRRDLFESYVPRIRALLKPNQLAAYEQMVEENRAKFEQRLRRAGLAE